jgi:GTP-binding protein HflX
MNVILISMDQNVSELTNLTESLGYSIDRIFVQKREAPDPRYYIGGGKTKEVSEYLKNNEIDIVIFNAKLKASQLFNLERILKKTVYDRIRLILEIFKDRAHSREAKLQVELARLQYEIPLVNEWIHRSKKGEHPGFLAGGEYAVQQYYDLIRKRIKKNKDKLQKLKKEREFRRSHRKDYGFYLVSLAGYTNAGKSTLLNELTDSNVVVEERVFSTLTTTTRKLAETRKQILLTDTVGFIKDLPPWLIEAFHSTLEEIFYSDIILLVVDSSEDLDEMVQKLNTCFQILWNADNVPPIIPVFNKIDLDEMTNLRKKINSLKEQNLIDDYIYISAKQKIFLDNLTEKIHQTLPEMKRFNLEIYSKSSKSIINFIKNNCYIINIDESDSNNNSESKNTEIFDPLDKTIIVEFECDEKNEKKVKKKIASTKHTRLISI